ncbi:bacterial Ig-like domain (group 1) [Halolamina pelagica]|uniref:Bacterial Ig-like domain (Group 1) n=1 Tax=Halolamina pelagica TaxID=699431 RepID=A0A0P7GAA2_9EURY|nr:Ig-like domain-containing protein [Halolamina pelagica]KPN30327.1 bacterial Ig-like domain (group 1) [Halolamina pelagica]
MLDPSRVRETVADRLVSLREDERAIEGLPVRLVVSLVVGAACLSVMLNLVNGVGGLAAAEVDVRPTPEVVETGPQELTLRVVDADGDPVSGATVIVDGGTASLDGVATAQTGADGNATVSIDPALGANQAEGTLVLDVKPPAGGSYVDRRENSHVLVIQE